LSCTPGSCIPVLSGRTPTSGQNSPFVCDFHN
jgi:hypothetical protein